MDKSTLIKFYRARGTMGARTNSTKWERKTRATSVGSRRSFRSTKMEKLQLSMQELEKKHNEHMYHSDLNWRAWGSWFSWGSPIGLTLGYAIVLVSTGLFILLLAMAHHYR